MNQPSQDDLTKALGDAGSTHHEYEQVKFGEKRDEQWSAFYTAFTLGRIGNFAVPSALVNGSKRHRLGENWPAHRQPVTFFLAWAIISSLFTAKLHT